MPIFDPTLVQYFIQIPHISFCCPLSAYDKWWFEQKKSPHFREKYLVLSYLKGSVEVCACLQKRVRVVQCRQKLVLSSSRHVCLQFFSFVLFSHPFLIPDQSHGNLSWPPQLPLVDISSSVHNARTCLKLAGRWQTTFWTSTRHRVRCVVLKWAGQTRSLATQRTATREWNRSLVLSAWGRRWSSTRWRTTADICTASMTFRTIASGVTLSAETGRSTSNISCSITIPKPFTLKFERKRTRRKWPLRM